MGAYLGFEMHSIDISNAFLNAPMDGTVYMSVPPGYGSVGGKEQCADDTLVCLLHKTLYGLKQAPRAWFEELSKTLTTLGFISCSADRSLWRHNRPLVLILVYVDDILILSETVDTVSDVKTAILEFDGLKRKIALPVVQRV